MVRHGRGVGDALSALVVDAVHVGPVVEGDAEDVVPDVRHSSGDTWCLAPEPRLARQVVETLTGPEGPGPRLHGRRLLPECGDAGVVEVVVALGGAVEETGSHRVRVQGVRVLVVLGVPEVGVPLAVQVRVDGLRVVVGPGVQETDTVGEIALGKPPDLVREAP